MAKKKPEKAGPLPHVQVAAFCENILEEKDNVFSAVRFVDTFYLPEAPPGPASLPEAAPHSAIALKALVMLKSGDAKGERTLAVQVVRPSGARADPVSVPMMFEGNESGVVLRLNIGVLLEGEGLYWCDLSMGGDLLTRMPFRISVAKTAPSEATEKPPKRQPKKS